MKKRILTKAAIACLILISMSLKTSAQTTPPFCIKKDLFNQTQSDNLGLSTRSGTETFTIFAPTDSTDHYSNGVVLTEFNGTLYCQWQSSATDEDAKDTWVAYSHSTDGIHWSAPQVLAPSPADGLCTSGGWWKYKDTLVAYINVWSEATTPRGGNAYYTTSIDGERWSPLSPVKMRDGSDMKGVFEQDPHALPDGRIVNAVHFQPGMLVSPAYTDDPLGVSGWEKADFTPSLYTGDVTNEIEPSWFLQGDSLIMTFRDQKSSYKKKASVSTDRGEHWTTPVVTNMPDSRSKQSNGNFPNGAAFMVNNPNDDKLRVPLAVTVSRDGFYFDRSFLLRAGGKSLQERRYEGQYKSLGYHYPKSMIYNGYLYVAYATNKEDVEYTRVLIESILR